MRHLPCRLLLQRGWWVCPATALLVRGGLRLDRNRLLLLQRHGGLLRACVAVTVADGVCVALTDALHVAVALTVARS